jgi:hypothetical protein
MDETPISELGGLRHEYDAHGLRRADLHSDPIEQFAPGSPPRSPPTFATSTR